MILIIIMKSVLIVLQVIGAINVFSMKKISQVIIALT